MFKTPIVVGAALLAGSVAAAPFQFHVDPAASSITFTLDAALHEVHGCFALEAASITFDPTTGEASGRIEIDAASGSTDNPKRDRKMHQSVLESARFPSIVLDVDGLVGPFQPTGDSAVELTGTLQLHGTPHAVKIPAQVHVEDGRLTGTATLTIPYVEWGLKDPSVFVLRVAKHVTVALNVSGVIEGP
jgi:polyisoprenoid-binding protein YceI